MFFACGKNVFYRIGQHPAEAAARPGAGHALAGAGHGLAAEGMAWRPTATACGRHALRAKPYPSIKSRGRRLGVVEAEQSCTAIKLVAGPALACAVLPCPCRRLLLPLILLLPILLLLCCSGPAVAPAPALDQGRAGVPMTAQQARGKADMGRPLRGLRPR